MLGKLLAALGTAKGAAAATVIAATVATGGVVATNQDVQQTLRNVVQNVTAECPKPAATGKPEVVALRNSADDKIRDAFREDQRELEHLRSTQVDNDARQRLNDAVKAADDRLRDRLTKALDDVAALTLGREGHEEQASPSKPDCDRGARADAKTKVDGIVTKAIADMNKIVDDAKTAVAAIPTRQQPGKPGEPPGAKPAEAGRPTGAPAGPPSPRPSPSR